MVRLNPASVFGDLDLENASSIRRLLVAMDYVLSNSVLNSRADEMESLNSVEKREMHALLATIRMTPRHPLLLEATLRFVEGQHGDDTAVLAAAKKLETLAEKVVFTGADFFTEEYATAEARYAIGRAADNFMKGDRTLLQRVSSPSPEKMTMLISNRLLAHLVTRATPINMVPSWRNMLGVSIHSCIPLSQPYLDLPTNLLVRDVHVLVLIAQKRSPNAGDVAPLPTTAYILGTV